MSLMNKSKKGQISLYYRMNLVFISKFTVEFVVSKMLKSSSVSDDFYFTFIK